MCFLTRRMLAFLKNCPKPYIFMRKITRMASNPMFSYGKCKEGARTLFYHRKTNEKPPYDISSNIRYTTPDELWPGPGPLFAISLCKNRVWGHPRDFPYEKTRFWGAFSKMQTGFFRVRKHMRNRHIYI